MKINSDPQQWPVNIEKLAANLVLRALLWLKKTHTIGNKILPLKCGYGIGYGISRKYQPIWILVSVWDLNRNSGFSRTPGWGWPNANVCWECGSLGDGIILITYLLAFSQDPFCISKTCRYFAFWVIHSVRWHMDLKLFIRMSTMVHNGAPQPAKFFNYRR